MVFQEGALEMNNSKDQVYANVSFEYIKLDESIEFFCDRCGKRKIAKKYAQYMDNDKCKKVCNACYGNILSKKTP